MNISETINRYLTLAMGECWHEGIGIVEVAPDVWSVSACPKCHKSGNPQNNNFFDVNGFFKLFGWVKQQDWWYEFYYYVEEQFQSNGWPTKLIDPEKLSITVYRFLRER